MSEMRDVALKEIAVREGFNPRREVDDGLTESVKRHGVLTPVTLTPSEGGYHLIAGERRLRAAIEAELESMPALIVESSDDDEGRAEQLAAAVVENVQRRDLTVVEEAQASESLKGLGYATRKQRASALGVSVDRVATYDAIASLPEPTQELVHEGKLTIGAGRELAKVAETSSRLAELIGQRATEFGWSTDDLVGGWPRLLAAEHDLVDEDGEYLDPEAEPQPLEFFVAYETYSPANFAGLSSEVAAAIYEAIEIAPYGLYLRFEEEDLDAANAYGCLVVHEPPQNADGWARPSSKVITDAKWATDRVEGAVAPRAIEKAKADAKRKLEREKQAPTGSGHAGGRRTSVEAEAAASGKTEAEVRKERAEVRDREYRTKVEAHRFNEKLGKQIFERLDEVELDEDVADALVALAFPGDRLQDVALRGLRFVHPALVTETEQKNGKVKLAFKGDGDFRDRQELTDAAKRFLADAKTPQQRVARLCQLMVAAHLADPRAVAPSKRFGFQLHGLDAREEKLMPKLVRKLTKGLRDDGSKRRKAIGADR